MFMLVYLSHEHNCRAFFVVNDWNSLDIFVHLTRLCFADLCASIRLRLSKILGPWVGLWVGFLVSVIIKIFFYGRESMGMFFKNKHMIYIRVIWSEILVKYIYHFYYWFMPSALLCVPKDGIDDLLTSDWSMKTTDLFSHQMSKQCCKPNSTTL